MKRLAVFVDFDGTITDLDTFDVLVKRLAGESVWRDFERSLDDGSRTLREVLQAQAGLVRGTFAEIAALLRREIRVDPTFGPFSAWCVAHDASLCIVSSGVEAIIRDRLGELGLGALPIVANDVVADPNGWQIRFRDPVSNGTDKAAVVRAAAGADVETVFIGDGRSDYLAALAADLRFAKRGLPLERYLRERGIAFEPFSDFAEIQTRLARDVVRQLPAEAIFPLR